MNQPSLFDRCRPTDPPTSQAAAADIESKLPELQRAMLQQFSKALTAQEAAANCVYFHGGNVESYRKRKHELHRKGLIEYVTTRVCQATGKRAEVFRRVIQPARI